MKLKKWRFSVLIILCIFLILSLTSLIVYKSSHKEQGVLLGNPIHNVSFQFPYDETFTSSTMDTYLLEKMIINDVKKVQHQKTIQISKLIQKSTYVVICIGQIDLAKKIIYDDANKTFLYDDDLIHKQMQIIVELLNNIILKIKEIQPHAILYLCQVRNPFLIKNEKVQQYFDLLNQNYLTLCKKYQAFLI